MKNNKEYIENQKKINEQAKQGEFITSYFSWNSLKDQKEKVDKLENITKKKNE